MKSSVRRMILAGTHRHPPIAERIIEVGQCSTKAKRTTTGGASECGTERREVHRATTAGFEGAPLKGEASRGVDGAMAPVFRNYAPGLGARGEREPGGGCWSPGNDERSTECSFRPPSFPSRLNGHQEGWTPPSLVVSTAGASTVVVVCGRVRKQLCIESREWAND